MLLSVSPHHLNVPHQMQGKLRQDACHCCLPATQLVIGDSPLNLNLRVWNVSGTFQMGTAACPIASLINVFIPGGNSTWGIYALRSASYDVHAKFTVSLLVPRYVLQGLQELGQVSAYYAVTVGFRVGSGIACVSVDRRMAVRPAKHHGGQ